MAPQYLIVSQLAMFSFESIINYLNILMKVGVYL